MRAESKIPQEPPAMHAARVFVFMSGAAEKSIAMTFPCEKYLQKFMVWVERIVRAIDQGIVITDEVPRNVIPNPAFLKKIEIFLHYTFGGVIKVGMAGGGTYFARHIMKPPGTSLEDADFKNIKDEKFWLLSQSNFKSIWTEIKDMGFILEAYNAAAEDDEDDVLTIADVDEYCL